MCMKIVIAILIFSLLIIFHELGHFLLAKANGIRVNEFCLGLGPKIFSIQKGETRYGLNLFPIGGACIMEGEDADSEDERSFGKKSVWARISVVVAGPVFNFIMAFVFAFILLCNIGYDLPTVMDVEAGYPAAEAGLKEGDTIVKMNRTRIHFFREISSYTQFHAGETVEITYERDGETYTTTLTPQYDEELGYYRYGIYGKKERQKGSVLSTFKYSFYEVGYWIKTTVDSLRSLVKGMVSVNDLSGPVGIVGMIGEGYEASAPLGIKAVIMQMLYVCIFLSANLGVMNLLPLPALDGGRLVFLIIEAIRGKKVDPEKEGMVHFAGMMLLFVLMGIVIFNDIRKLIL